MNTTKILQHVRRIRTNLDGIETSIDKNDEHSPGEIASDIAIINSELAKIQAALQE